jgi:hypothetical protein
MPLAGGLLAAEDSVETLLLLGMSEYCLSDEGGVGTLWDFSVADIHLQ